MERSLSTPVEPLSLAAVVLHTKQQASKMVEAAVAFPIILAPLLEQEPLIKALPGARQMAVKAVVLAVGLAPPEKQMRQVLVMEGTAAQESVRQLRGHPLVVQAAVAVLAPVVEQAALALTAVEVDKTLRPQEAERQEP